MNINRKKEIKLQINDITIKTIKPSDVTQDYLKWLTDYEIVKFTEKKNRSHSIGSIKKYVFEKYNSYNNYLFGIFIKKNHTGNIKLGPIDCDKKKSELSYFIDNKKFWNQGITSKVIKLVSEFASMNIGIKEIFAGSYENNKASKKVLSNNGFTIVQKKLNDREFEGRKINIIIMKKILI